MDFFLRYFSLLVPVMYFKSKYAALVYTRDKRLDEVPGVARGIKKKLLLKKNLDF